jgi:hypothetical protein
MQVASSSMHGTSSGMEAPSSVVPVNAAAANEAEAMETTTEEPRVPANAAAANEPEAMATSTEEPVVDGNGAAANEPEAMETTTEGPTTSGQQPMSESASVLSVNPPDPAMGRGTAGPGKTVGSACPSSDDPVRRAQARFAPRDGMCFLQFLSI